MLPLRKLAQHPLLPEASEEETNKRSVVVCKARGDNLVVSATEAFALHTGYETADIIGKNLRLLQGEQTSLAARQLFRHLISNRMSGVVDILNYHRSGKPFFHRVELHPVFDQAKQVDFIIAMQTPID
ncbi:MAG: PAS domain-containing protein [Hyphomonadaceae bacterium]